jgi:hypothetical protein
MGIAVGGQVLPQHCAIEDPMHEPLDLPSRFAGQWTLASLILDTSEPVAHRQRFYFGQWKFAAPGPNVIVDVGEV